MGQLSESELQAKLKDLDTLRNNLKPTAKTDDKNASKITIQNTVTIKTVSCNAVQNNANVFKGAKKLNAFKKKLTKAGMKNPKLR